MSKSSTEARCLPNRTCWTALADASKAHASQEAATELISTGLNARTELMICCHGMQEAAKRRQSTAIGRTNPDAVARRWSAIPSAAHVPIAGP
jgi:hypothetical protein